MLCNQGIKRIRNAAATTGNAVEVWLEGYKKLERLYWIARREYDKINQAYKNSKFPKTRLRNLNLRNEWKKRCTTLIEIMIDYLNVDFAPPHLRAFWRALRANMFTDHAILLQVMRDNADENNIRQILAAQSILETVTRPNQPDFIQELRNQTEFDFAVPEEWEGRDLPEDFLLCNVLYRYYSKITPEVQEIAPEAGIFFVDSNDELAALENLNFIVIKKPKREKAANFEALFDEFEADELEKTKTTARGKTGPQKQKLL